jgi:hypothetical protein
MYKHTLKELGQIFEEGISLPQASPYLCATALNVGNNVGMLACTITANTEVAIAAGQAVTIAFQHGDSEAGAFTDHSSHSITLAAAVTVAPGRIVARVVLPPDTKPWLKAKVGSSGSGKIDVFIEYLAR